MNQTFPGLDEYNLWCVQRMPSWHQDPTRFEALLKIFFERDPIGITYYPENKGAATEYSFEVDRILTLLDFAKNIEDVEATIYDVFVRCFSEHIFRRPGREILRPVAEDIWKMLREVSSFRSDENDALAERVLGDRRHLD